MIEPALRRHVCGGCEGRGWKRPKVTTDFPHVCPACGGRGWMSLKALAPLVHQHVDTMARVILGRARVASATAVLRGKHKALLKCHPSLWEALRKGALACLEGRG